MDPFHLQSAAEQVAQHLRAELKRGRWNALMPGVNGLASELGVNRKTVEAAMQLLVKQGLLKGQGAGRRRAVVPQPDNVPPQRVGIMLHDGEIDLEQDYVVELRHVLTDAGHTPVVHGSSVCALGLDVKRVARSVGQVNTDAWIILAGTREIIEWFSEQAKPAFALFGRRTGLPIAAAGPDKRPAILAMVEQLVALGHRRIVNLTREDRRLPVPGPPEQFFLDELTRHGIQTGPYNLPAWEGTPEGLEKILNSLFKVTPPTALILDEAMLFIATMQFLADRGIRVPEEVSLICADPNLTFSWCSKSVAHIDWESRPIVRRVARWAKAVATGREDTTQTLTPASYMAGDTVGPAKA